METLLFKTNIPAPDISILNKLVAALENIDGIVQWKLDIDSIYKLLIIKGRALNPIHIIKELQHRGIDAIRLFEE